MPSKSIDRAANSSRSTVEKMGINHGRFDVIMAQEFLDCADALLIIYKRGIFKIRLKGAILDRHLDSITLI